MSTDEENVDIWSEISEEEWKNIVDRLDHEFRNGDLCECAFHGTGSIHETDIREMGLCAGLASAADDDEEESRTRDIVGTHWASPRVASFYAEDTVEYRDGVRPLIVLAFLDDLEKEGFFEADAGSIESPICSRMALNEEEARSAWKESDYSWRDCFDIFESFIVANPVGPEYLYIIKDMNDVENVIEAAKEKRRLLTMSQ